MFSGKEIKKYHNDLNRPKRIYMKIELSTNEILKGVFNLTYDSLIYFQTDKPIYRPTETVRFRVLETDKSLRSKPDMCNLTIKVIYTIYIVVNKSCIRLICCFSGNFFNLESSKN